jgi:DNA-binding IclR family transcriptional regulator
MIAPATATQLAERVGESPANCSWHLRQLARYGFVEEAGGGTGREGPWRPVPGVCTWDATTPTPSSTSPVTPPVTP